MVSHELQATASLLTFIYLLLFIFWLFIYYCKVKRCNEPVGVDELRAGDHIYLPSLLTLPFTSTAIHFPGYSHHAVYLGTITIEGRQLEAITDFTGRSPVIRELDQFLAEHPDEQLFRRNYYTEQETIRNHEKTIVVLARRIVQKGASYPPYRVCFNNDEVYVDLLETGPYQRAVSLESINWLIWSFTTITAIVGLVFLCLVGCTHVGEHWLYVLAFFPLGLMGLVGGILGVFGFGTSNRLHDLTCECIRELDTELKARKEREERGERNIPSDPLIDIDPQDLRHLHVVARITTTNASTGNPSKSETETRLLAPVGELGESHDQTSV